MALAQRHLIRVLACVFLLVAPAILRSQTSPAPEAPAPQFRVVSIAGVETFFFDVEKKKESLNAAAGSFSQLYPAPKNRDVVFYREVPNADPKLPPVKTPVAKAQLPAQKIGPFLILIAKNPPEAELAYNTLVIDQSLEAHPANNYRVFNFSKRRLAVNIADTKMVLPTGQYQTAPYPTSRKAWLQVAADEKADGWLLVSSSAHPVGADSRTSIFLVDIAPSPMDPNPKGIVARRIRESITTDEKGVQHVR
ncbi:hypothetical protein [Rariglobus hedericola]|uniref:DUF4397 domain-containing protein n=1 Tax=Rariglobus hedericola TaxID=2597822 RepID=A0A556QJY9_9BACT|nr:hypothetical protein [Rariglobus hedericola]TSJ76932.1 hypothetical protein FPL22_12505 [Rariglobus hedericola]